MCNIIEQRISSVRCERSEIPRFAMAAAAMMSFDSLSDEMALKIIKIAATPKSNSVFKYDHNFLCDIICNVSVRLRRIATDSSLWKDNVMIYIPPNDFSKLDLVVQECLNGETKDLTITTKICFPAVMFPLLCLSDLSTMFPNLKIVNLRGFCLEKDIPAPWIDRTPTPYTNMCTVHTLTRD